MIPPLLKTPENVLLQHPHSSGPNLKVVMKFVSKGYTDLQKCAAVAGEHAHQKENCLPPLSSKSLDLNDPVAFFL